MIGSGQSTLMLALSLDGFLADGQGQTNLWGEDALAGFDVVVLGRGAYERLCHSLHASGAPWPYRGKRVDVLTHRPLADTPYPGVRATTDLAQAVTSARAQGRSIWLAGGASVIAQALAAGVVDDIDLYTLPITLGSGVRAWPPGKSLRAFSLLMVEPLPGGVIHSRYGVD